MTETEAQIERPLACPFCGRPAKVRYFEEAHRWQVGCTMQPGHDAMSVAPSETEAIAGWNQRAVIAEGAGNEAG